jgi:hypothetical protein
MVPKSGFATRQKTGTAAPLCERASNRSDPLTITAASEGVIVKGSTAGRMGAVVSPQANTPTASMDRQRRIRGNAVTVGVAQGLEWQPG